jgi:tripartite-type tricarboxylate transporter receptor subunit TctC
MKKLLSLFLLTFSLVGYSAELVKSTFPFVGVAEHQRHLFEKANATQDKWNFVITTKSGAGGAIAALDVLQNNSSILIGNSSFFIRPNLANSTYQVDEFKLLSVGCSSPVVIVSNKYKSLNDIKGPVSIGISGMGSLSHVVALELAQKYPELLIVPYKGMSETLQGLMTGEIDMTVQYLKPIEEFVKVGKINVLGITGNKSYLNIPTLTNQGFKNTNLLTNNFILLVPKNTPKELYDEWRQLFSKIDNRERYNDEMCTPIKETADWFNEQQIFWKNIILTLKVKE